MNWRRLLLASAGGLLAVLVLVVVAVAVLAVPVLGQSMRPTLADRDRILLAPFAGPGDVRRFDVVAARFTIDSPLVVKRVIALGGDHVRIERAQGQVRVLVRPAGSDDWQRVVNPAWQSWSVLDDGTQCCAADGRSSPEATDTQVPDGELFLIGDNAVVSEDSRRDGFAPRALVRGVVWLRVWPLGAFGQLSADVRLEPLERA